MSEFGILDAYTRKALPVVADPETIALAESRPAVTGDRATGEQMFGLSYRAHRAAMFDWVVEREYSMVEQAIEEARKRTGRTLGNPYHWTPEPDVGAVLRAWRDGTEEDRARVGLGGNYEALFKAGDFPTRFARFVAEYDEIRRSFPNLPDPRGFRDAAIAELKKRREAVELARANTTGLVERGPLGVRMGGDVGDFFGGMAAEFTHPMNIATLWIGAPAVLYAPVRAGLASAVGRALATGAIEGAVGAGTQAFIEYEKLARLPGQGVPYSDAEAWDNIVGAGAMGFLFGAGLRGLVGAYRHVRERHPPARSVEADDLATIGERLALDAETAPPGMRGEHAEALAKARQDIAAGRPVDVSPVIGQRELPLEQPLAPVAPEPAPRPAPGVEPSAPTVAVPGAIDPIVSAFGGERAMANAFGVSVETIRRWQQAGAVPTARLADLRAAALRIGVDLDAAMQPPASPPARAARAIVPIRLSPPASAPAGSPANAAAVYTPTGRRIEVEYEVVDVRHLVPSHLDDLRPNGAFPAELQPRDRSRAASEAQIAEMAGNLQPERLGRSPDATTGAPIVGPDNVVESGNGRVLAIRRANSDAYRAWLVAQGHDLTGIERPILIARRVTPLDPAERVAFAREANAASAMRMAASETAASDAALVKPILDLYRGGDVSFAQNADFVRAFLKGLPPTERAALWTEKGGLSQDGIRRLQGALLHAAYEDGPLVAKLMESQTNEIKAIGGALLDAAPGWAQMRERARAGLIAPDMDRTADLMLAVDLMQKARNEGHKVVDLLNQGGLFDTPEAARLFLVMFHQDGTLARPAGRAAVAQKLAGYVEAANKTSPGADMFGTPPPRAEELLASPSQRAITAASREAAEARPQPSPAETKVAASARVEEARALVGLDPSSGARGAKDLEIVVGDAKVPARQALADADAAVKKAEIINQCAVGSAI